MVKVEFVFKESRVVSGHRHEAGEVLLDTHLPRHVTIDTLALALQLGVLFIREKTAKPEPESVEKGAPKGTA